MCFQKGSFTHSGWWRETNCHFAFNLPVFCVLVLLQIWSCTRHNLHVLIWCGYQDGFSGITALFTFEIIRFKVFSVYVNFKVVLHSCLVRAPFTHVRFGIMGLFWVSEKLIFLWLVFLLILLREMKPYSWFLTYILHKLSWQGIVTSSGALLRSVIKLFKLGRCSQLSAM